jgi:hypothetical protein
MMDHTDTDGRPLGAWLVIGIIIVPVIFAWFTLRRGHSNSTRLAAFAYLAASVVIGVMATWGRSDFPA